MLKTVHDLFFKKSSSSNLQIHSLDGLRGIAILFVLLSHMSKGDLHLLPWINFSGSGTYGVFLFFVLSAFLLTLPFFEHYRHRLSEPGIWLSYALRRFFRIFPLYIIVLLVSFIFSGTGNFIRLSGHDLWNHIILREGKSILWTIPVEFKYYFFLPLVVIFFIVFLRARYGFVVVAVAAAVTIIYAFYISSGKTFSQVSLIRYFPVFLLGSLTAFTHQCLFMAYPYHPLLQKSSPAVTHIQCHLYFFTGVSTVRCFVCGYRAPISSNPHLRERHTC